MRKPIGLVLASVLSFATLDAAMAQPGPYGHPPPPGAPYGGPQTYYYNGRWVGPDEWNRHRYERDRWTRNYNRRHHHDDDTGAALAAGIIGFALGAAIVGSQQQAERARSADRALDDACARRYRSYDRHSRTYLGSDGLRHYCQ